MRQGQSARVTFFHHYDSRIIPQPPRELPLSNVHCEHFGGSALQQAIGKTARRCTKVNNRPTRHIHMEVVQGVIEFVSTAADESLGARNFHGIRGFDSITGFAGHLAIDPNLAGHDGALGFLAALAEPAFHEDLIQPRAHRARLTQTTPGMKVES